MKTLILDLIRTSTTIDELAVLKVWYRNIILLDNELCNAFRDAEVCINKSKFKRVWTISELN